MNRFLSFAANKKTYGVVLVGLVLGVVQGLDDTHVIAFHIPTFVDVLLGFLGLGTLRHGVQTSSEQATVAIVNLIETLLSSTEDPEKRTNLEKVQQVIQSPVYKNAPTEEAKTDLLNSSQLASKE